MKNVKFSLISLIIVGTILSMPASFAASQCKGLVKGDCDKLASCSWVDGYERKDGKKVAAFCRSKPQQKAKKS